MKESLINELAIHFNQNLVCENWNIQKNYKRAKESVNERKQQYIDFIFCIAVSNDESIYVSGEMNGTIKVWELKSCSKICVFLKHKRCIQSLAIGKENSMLLSGCKDCIVRLWDLKLKKHVLVLKVTRIV